MNTPLEPVGMLLGLRTHSWTTVLRRKSVRTELEGRLREAGSRYRLPVLGYVVMPQTVGILVIPNSLERVGRFVGCLRGGAASAYARRSHREGPFWRKRAEYSLIQGVVALRRCLEMLVWEPARQEIALHPSAYAWNGYRELVGLRRRYRVLDHRHLNRLYESGDNLYSGIAENIETNHGGAHLLQDWTQALAIGDQNWIETAKHILHLQRPSILTLDESGKSATYALTVAHSKRRYCLRKLIDHWGGCCVKG